MYKNLAAAFAAACFSLSAFFHARWQGQDKPPLKVNGFVYVTPLSGAGWVYQHDQGRKAMEAALNPAPGQPQPAACRDQVMSRTWPKARMPSA
jgi:basic membrane lipoprotein Med (substrate-binding protein (PBP1-ABC) superfamily)